eukprot:gene97-4346_t
MKKKDNQNSSAPSKVKVTLKYKDEENNVIESSKEFQKQEEKIDLPLNLGVVTILSLGKVDVRKNFHNDRYIFPVGYKSERNYNSYINPSEKVQYTCEILSDENTESPVFKVTPNDDPTQSFTSTTPTGAWTPIIKKVQESRKKIGGKRQYSTVSGPEYFGLSNPKCRELLNSLENADKCESYQEPKDVMEEELDEEFIPQEEEKDEDFEPIEEEPKIRKSKRKAITKMEQMEEIKSPKKTKLKQPSFPGISPNVPLKELEPHQYRFLTQGLEIFDGYEPFASMYKKEALEKIQPTFQTIPMANNSSNPYQFTMYGPNVSIPQNQRLFTTQNTQTQNLVPIPNTKVVNTVNQNITQSTTVPTTQSTTSNVHGTNSEVQQTISNGIQQNQNVVQTKQNLIPQTQNTLLKPNIVPTPQLKVVDFEKEVKLLRNMWEFAFVCHSLALLRPILKITEFTPLELEKALISPNEHNGVLADIHIRLIKGPAIDRKAYESLQPNSTSWMRITQNKLDTVDTTYWGSNPLRRDKYANITPVFRVLILKSIIDWKIINNQKCSDYIHNLDEMLRFDPLGFDKDDNIYWYFGEEVGRLYKETSIVQENKKFEDESKSSLWSISCDSIEEFKSFMDELEQSLNENESKLFEALKYIFPTLETYKNESKIRVKQREEQKILEAKKREEEARKKEERRIKQRMYQEQRRKELEEYQQQLMSQMSSSFTSTPTKQNGEHGDEDEEFEGRTRSGRAIRRRIIIDEEEEEKGDESLKDDEPLSFSKKKRQQDDDEFRIVEDEEEEDEDIEEDDILTDEEEEAFETEEEEYESDEEYGSPKRTSRTSRYKSKNQKNFFIPSSNTTTYKPLAPIMTSFKQQPLAPQVPLTGGTQQPLMNSPSFQAYYQQYLKLLLEQQKKSLGNTSTTTGTSSTKPNTTVYQPNPNFVPQKKITSQQSPAPQQVVQKPQQVAQQPIQRIKISQNAEKESSLNNDNFFNMIPDSDFTTDEMDTIDSVLSNQRDLLE